MEHAEELEMQISKVEREIKFSSADENIFKKILCDSIEFMLQDGLRNYNSHKQTGFGKGHRIKSMNWKFFTSRLTAATPLRRFTFRTYMRIGNGFPYHQCM